MKKKILIALCIILATIGVVFLSRRSELSIKYSFWFVHFPAAQKVEQWDNGLPGDPKSSNVVYAYEAQEEYMGPYTQRYSVRIYNQKMETYLDKKYSEGYAIESMKIFGMGDVKKVEKLPPSDRDVAGWIGFCRVYAQHDDLMYEIDCGSRLFLF